MSILFHESEMYYYTTTPQSGVARLSVYSLTNVGTNVPALLRAYNSTVCTDISPETRTAVLQNYFYVVCSRSVSTLTSSSLICPLPLSFLDHVFSLRPFINLSILFSCIMH